MNYKRAILVISFLAVCGFIFNFSAPEAKAVTFAELREKIKQLQEQIAQLQQQLFKPQGEEKMEEEVWCHDFNVNLRIGDTGSEVRALQIALQKEGFYKRKITGNFDEYTASAVVGFQEKYKEEILAPWGLERGTGFVGPTTRAKLNKLYGCKAVKPSLTVISPNGGEKWEIGKTYDITWRIGHLTREKPASNVSIFLINYQSPTESRLIAFNVRSERCVTYPYFSCQGKYSWKIPSSISPGSKYKVLVVLLDSKFPWKIKPAVPLGSDLYNQLKALLPQLVYDESDNYFSVVGVEIPTCHTSPLWSWDYCSPTCKCHAEEGDCDTDADCYTGYCAQDVGAKYGQVPSMDVCEERVPQPSITVISPNGGEKWEIGKTYTITWDHNLAGNFEARIDLLKGGKYYGAITDIPFNAQNLTSYSWQVGDTKVGDIKVGVVEGDDYQVRISYTEVNTGVRFTDTSDSYFSIFSIITFQPSVTVISPNGGERWEIGKTYDIKWRVLTKEKSASNVNIFLINYHQSLTKSQPIAFNIPPKTCSYPLFSYSCVYCEDKYYLSCEGKYSWKIPSSISPGSKYKVLVVLAEPRFPKVKDESDNYFAIIKPYKIPVLVLKYFPTKDGITIDSTIVADDVPRGRTIAEQRKITNDLNNRLIVALEKGSTYHGYKNPLAPPSLDYYVVEEKEYLTEMPASNSPGITPGSRLVDYFKIMTDLDICNYVENQGVKEVWIWGYAARDNRVHGWESNFSSSYGDIGNSNRDPKDLPICKKSYTVYTYNYGRELGCALEDHGHQIEAILNWVDGRDVTPPDQWPNLLFWGKFVGRDKNNKILPPVSACGWTHCPPNTEVDYDWYNKTKVLSDCEDWKPDRTGERKLVNCQTWTGNENCRDDRGGDSFKIWWMQNIPGQDNNLYYEGKKLRNWWDFIGDFDKAMRIGKSLTY